MGVESPEAIRQPSRAVGVEMKRWSRPHGDVWSNLSEIPCRVSSDLHEWRNDLGTVSTKSSAKLEYR